MAGSTSSGWIRGTRRITETRSSSIPTARMAATRGPRISLSVMHSIPGLGIRIKVRSATTSQSFPTAQQETWLTPLLSTAKKTSTTRASSRRALFLHLHLLLARHLQPPQPRQLLPHRPQRLLRRLPLQLLPWQPRLLHLRQQLQPRPPRPSLPLLPQLQFHRPPLPSRPLPPQPRPLIFLRECESGLATTSGSAA